MAAAYIVITQSSPRAQALLQLIRQLIQVWGGLQQAAGELNAMVDSGDYSLIETLFLAPATGQGQTLYNLVVGANAAVNVPAITQLINEVG